MEKKLLSDLGLSVPEIQVYEAVFKAGQITPTALAKAAGIKRTTAYSIIAGLLEKGLLVEDSIRRPRAITLALPEDIEGVIESEQRRLNERKKLFKELTAVVSRAQAENTYTVPSVRFIEEAKLGNFLHQQTEVWDKSIIETKETTWWGFQDHTFVEHYSDWILWYWERFPEGVDLRLLSNRAEVEVKFGPKIGPRRQIKFWGEATNFLSTTWAIGDYLVMINTRTRPFYLVEIHDKLMAHDQREVFRNLWPLVP